MKLLKVFFFFFKKLLKAESSQSTVS